MKSKKASGGSQYLRNGKTHYQRNRLQYIERQRHRKALVRKFLQDYRSERGCKDCGIRDWRVLEFDHLHNKKYTIASTKFRSLGMEAIKNELDKCEVVCANCHRIRTLLRAGMGQGLFDCLPSSST